MLSRFKPEGGKPGKLEHKVARLAVQRPARNESGRLLGSGTHGGRCEKSVEAGRENAADDLLTDSELTF